MHKLRKYLKTEMDVEFFACVHSVSLIFVYGFFLWITGEAMVSFAVIVEMMVLGYAIAWTQKGLFWQEREYTKKEYAVRQILWNLLPMIYLPLAGSICGWFCDVTAWVPVAFYTFMDCYIVLIWLFLRYVNKEDSDELNQLIWQRKGSDKGGE